MYFPNGALKQFTYGNGIVHTMAQNARQLPASNIDTGGALSQQFVYDENGNVTAVTDALDPARSKAMVYDGLDRLTSASATVFGGTGVHQFVYDPLDNLRSWTLGGVKDQSNYVYGADNRLSQIKDTGGNVVHAFSYDPQGNVTTRNGVAHDFDFGNRLRSVNASESYLYDGHGRRVQTTQAGASVTRWMYTSSGQMLFSAKGPSNPTTHENVYLAGSLVAIIDRASPSNTVTATTYQHTDALGSPVAMSNEAGAIIERTNYDPYGGPIGKTVNGLGYTGHVMDGVTGLTYMQQRYYDQGVGRFLSVDPVTASPNNGGNFNRYNYAANSPYKYKDPDGRMIRSPGDGLPESGTSSCDFDPGCKFALDGPEKRYANGRNRGRGKAKEHVLENPESLIDQPAKDEDNNGVKHCAELLKVAFRSQGIPTTAGWGEGRRITFGTDVAAGTAIATFVSGKYPQTGSGFHSAIYLRQDAGGIYVIDQYDSGPDYRSNPDPETGEARVQMRYIPWNRPPGTSASNDGAAFSTVTW